MIAIASVYDSLMDEFARRGGVLLNEQARDSIAVIPLQLCYLMCISEQEAAEVAKHLMLNGSVNTAFVGHSESAAEEWILLEYPILLTASVAPCSCIRSRTARAWSARTKPSDYARDPSHHGRCDCHWRL